MKGKKPNHGGGTARAESPASHGTQSKGRLWIEKQGRSFCWGRVVLLERIRETGSIAAAASKNLRDDLHILQVPWGSMISGAHD
jgi:hypothetical protein